VAPNANSVNRFANNNAIIARRVLYFPCFICRARCEKYRCRFLHAKPSNAICQDTPLKNTGDIIREKDDT